MQLFDLNFLLCFTGQNACTAGVKIHIQNMADDCLIFISIYIYNL